MSDFSPQAANFSAKKQALLELLRKKKTNGFNIFPLSLAQERLWFLDQWEPGSPLYNIFMALRLTGQIHTTALEQTINEIVRRHESLRTTFTAVEGQAVQVIAPTIHIPLNSISLEDLPESAREARARTLAIEESQFPFDLNHGPLIRSSLLRLTENDQVLLLTIHHIATDGWSMGIFIREFAALYNAFCAGKPSPLPELPIQYADFALWQREWLQGDVLERQLAYWKQQLEGAPTILELPTDRPRPAVQTFRGAHKNFLLPRAFSDKLKALSRQEGVTLFMMLLATFQILLFRYTGQEDFLVGTPIANRNRPELEQLIGFFVNMLVLRSNLSDNPSFRQLLRRVRETCLGAYAHQDLPFERLVETRQPERDLSHPPLFQVIFQIQNTPTKTLVFPGMTLSSLNVETAVAKFDLSLNIMEDWRGLLGVLEYNTDLFYEDTMDRLLDHWRNILDGIVTNIDQYIENLSLLTDDERQKLLVEWNGIAADYTIDRCVHELFEAQVERTPEHIAVIFGNEKLTYRELNRQANQLAHYLQSQGVGPEILVALLNERGANLLVAILAVFKAGGAYLPLDPNDPPTRLGQLLERSHCPLVLTTTKFASLLPQVLATMQPDEVPRILYTEELPLQEQAEVNLTSSNTLDHLAYVMYTSGSTGVPKGAMIEQKGMLNHLYAKIKNFGMTESDVVAHTASQCFDISVWQFLAILLVGGRVHIFEDETIHDIVHLLAEFDKHGVSIFETSPSLLQVMLGAIESGDVARPNMKMARWNLSSGEALTPDMCQRWLKCYPHIPLVNAYGATECSDDVTNFPIYQPLAATVQRTPVGRPINNMRQYVLDRHLVPVPVGVSGEIYFGGIGVGRGYLGDAQRTAEVFIPDPFSEEAGSRLYKTGDLARYLSDGSLEFLGRVDHQVKVRGFRIELGEIEIALREHPSIRDVIVLAREISSGDKQLVAYIVAKQHTTPETSELRNFLKEKLPDYMVPTIFISLEKMPLTSNDKIDRRALPEPSIGSLSNTTFVEPRNPIEQMLADIWTEILAVKQVSIYDNFFDLGGHSLLATQLVSRLRNAFQVELSLRNLFEAPTVIDLAEIIIQRLAEQVDSEMLAALEQLSPDNAQTMLSAEKLKMKEGHTGE